MRKRIRYPPWLHELLILLFVSLLFCQGCRSTPEKTDAWKILFLQELIIESYHQQDVPPPSKTCRGPK